MMNNAAMNMSTSSSEILILFLMDIYQEVGLLNLAVVRIFNFFEEAPYCFP